MKKIILTNDRAAGDVLMLTAFVRDMHRAYPGEFLTDVWTGNFQMWDHNPHITPLVQNAPDVVHVRAEYPAIESSNVRPGHFITAFHEYLEEKLTELFQPPSRYHIPVTEFRGDIHLSVAERQPSFSAHYQRRCDGSIEPLESPAFSMPFPERPYWIVVAGGKYDFTTKWWNPAHYQSVVDMLAGEVNFVQCGLKGHWHPPLRGVTNFVGKTNLRHFLQLIHHSEGVLCPVTFAMHAAAALPMESWHTDRSGKTLPRLRPCVVIAGGREAPHWEAYPGHQFLHTVGTLPCCAHGGCYCVRCQKVGDVDDAGEPDHRDCENLCQLPVAVSNKLMIPQCMNDIAPETVVASIRRFENLKLFQTEPSDAACLSVS